MNYQSPQRQMLQNYWQQMAPQPLAGASGAQTGGGAANMMAGATPNALANPGAFFGQRKRRQPGMQPGMQPTTTGKTLNPGPEIFRFDPMAKPGGPRPNYGGFSAAGLANTNALSGKRAF